MGKIQEGVKREKTDVWGRSRVGSWVDDKLAGVGAGGSHEGTRGT